MNKIKYRLLCIFAHLKDIKTQLSLCPLLTALLLCVCMTVKDYAWVSYLALFPLALVLVAVEVRRSVYASAYLAGLTIHLVGMSWVLECYRYENVIGPYLVQWFWIGSWGGAMLTGMVASGRFIHRRYPLPMTFLLPVLWVSYEFIRHQMAETVTGTGFPWLKLGMAFADTKYVVQIADLGGEYLLSFLAALTAGAVVDLWQWWMCIGRNKSQLKYVFAVTFATVCVVSAHGYGAWRTSQSVGGPGLKVGLMGELDLPPLIEERRLQEGFGVEGGLPRNADLLLWPELAYHHAIVESSDYTLWEPSSADGFLPVNLTNNKSRGLGQRYLEQSAKELGSTLVIGCERHQLSEAKALTYNSLACVDPLTGYQGCYDKVNLVPGTESAMRSTESFHGGEFEYNRGDGYRTFSISTENEVHRFAVAICYDLCFGQHFQNPSYSNLTDERPDFLVQSGAEGQDSTDLVAALMLRYARVRAIENRRSLVRNVTLGHSALIDGNGKYHVVLPTTPITSPVWLGAVPIDKRFSLYAYCGDWIAYLSCLVTLALALIKPNHC